MAFVRKPGLYVIFIRALVRSQRLSACSERFRPAIVLRITRDIRSVPDRVKRLLFSCQGLSGLMQVYTPPGRPAKLAFRMHHDTSSDHNELISHSVKCFSIVLHRFFFIFLPKTTIPYVFAVSCNYLQAVIITVLYLL